MPTSRLRAFKTRTRIQSIRQGGGFQIFPQRPHSRIISCLNCKTNIERRESRKQGSKNRRNRQQVRKTQVAINVGKVCIRAKWPIRPELIPVSVAWSDWEYFYSPLDGMLVHRRVTPSIKFAGTHLYTWVERGTVRVKCPARTRSARSGVECANHEATAPPTAINVAFQKKIGRATKKNPSNSGLLSTVKLKQLVRNEKWRLNFQVLRSHYNFYFFPYNWV